MLKKVKRFMMTGVASLLTMVALTGIGPSSLWVLYEPDMPESLKR